MTSEARSDPARAPRRIPPRDDFVRVPLPLIAGRGDAAIAAGVREYDQQAKVVDARLFHKVTLREKGVALADLCAELKHQLGVELSASPAVGDEKVTVFVKEEPVRDVMRAVARLFGYFWSRHGQEGAYRYELNQDLRAQLAEGELRNRDFDAALLGLDAQMEKLHPYLEPDQEGKHSFQDPADREALRRLQFGGWGGAQLYFRLTPAERTALAGGEELVFRPDDPDPDRRLPAEWQRPILKAMAMELPAGGPITQITPIEDVPGIEVAQVRLHLNRSELGQVSLSVRTIPVLQGHPEDPWPYPFDQEMAIGRSPSATSPENAKADQALRGRPPFDRIVSLRPEPSFPSPKGGAPGAKGAPRSPSPGNAEQAQYEVDTPQGVVVNGPPGPGHAEQPRRVLSADVWEAVHKETGLPIVADFYSHLYPAASVTVARKSLFDALCGVSDAMGARWTKSGDFLLCRSASYFWDKLKEVPNRYLSHWAHDRDANGGGLPLHDFLEMATRSDEQLSSQIVGDAIRECWGLGGWCQLRSPDTRRRARFLGTLRPAQLQRTLQEAGLPLHDMSPAQQGAVYQFTQAVEEEAARQGASSTVNWPLWWRGTLKVQYIPAGWYIWTPPNADPAGPAADILGARTAAEALALARRRYAPASGLEIHYSTDGYFIAGVWY